MNNDDAHWHLLVNHWPILGGMLATFVLVCGLMAYVGSLGGVIRHTEIRDSAGKIPSRPAQ